MKGNRTSIIIGVAVAVILAVLFAIPKLTDSTRGLARLWKEAGIDCLSGGHSKALQHFHPHLTILVDGAPEHLSVNIGIASNCMAEIHTHDATGTLHVETISAAKIMRLKDFFAVYGKPFERAGYQTLVAVDGQSVSEGEDLILKDKQVIVVEYKSK